MHRRLVPLLLVGARAATLAPHAVFSRFDAMSMYRRFMPPLETPDGVVSTTVVKRHLVVQKVLKQKNAFMVLGWDGLHVNAFFCSTHLNGTMHRIEACAVYEEEQDDALNSLYEWHSVVFEDRIELQLVL